MSEISEMVKFYLYGTSFIGSLWLGAEIAGRIWPKFI